MMRVAKHILSVFSLLCAFHSPAAQVELDAPQAKHDRVSISADGRTEPVAPRTIKLTGTIELGDLERIRNALARARREGSDQIIVMLESNGGDLATALAIGRLIRTNHAETFAFECSSACVLILAGGVHRFALATFGPLSVGRIGIHRPYSTDLDRTYEQKRKDFQAIDRGVREFLREGGVSEKLWDEMLHVSSEDARYLTNDEILGYGLGGDDPTYADFLDSREAKRRGISKTEYLRRKALVRECSSIIQRWIKANMPPQLREDPFANYDEHKAWFQSHDITGMEQRCRREAVEGRIR